MSSDFFSNQELKVFEEAIIKARRLLYMNKNDATGLSDSLKSLSLRTGWAIYLWADGIGLSNLKSTEPPSPKTQKIDQALEFASKRKHFSVFVFPIMDKNVWLDTKLYLTKKKKLSVDVAKFLFILPKGYDNALFEKLGNKINLSFGLDGEFVLRNGAWINSNAIL